MNAFVILCAVLYLCINTSEAVQFKGPTFENTNFCSTTARDIKLRIKEVNVLRVLCEGSSFKSADCSNYWARAEDVLELSTNFQKCLDHQVSDFRTWAVGTDPNTGAFVTNAQGDRAVLDASTAATLTLFNNETAALVDLYRTLEDAKRTTLSTELQESLASTETVANDEYNNTRFFDENTEEATRVFAGEQQVITLNIYQTAEDNVSTTAFAAAEQEQDDVNSATTTIDTSSYLQSNTTRALVDSDSAAIQGVVDSEETSTRSEYDVQTQVVGTAFEAALLSTEQAILATHLSQQALTQSVITATEGAIRAEALNQLNLDVVEIRQQQQLVKSTLNSALAAKATLVQGYVNQAEAQTIQTDSANAQLLRNASISSTLAVDAAIRSTGATLQAAALTAADIAANVTKIAQNTQAFFNADLPPLFPAMQNITANFNAEASLVQLFFAHLNLARNDTWTPNIHNPHINFFLATDLVSPALVQSTISYYGTKYGANATVSANVYYSKAQASTDSRTAMTYYRMAYNAAVTPH